MGGHWRGRKSGAERAGRGRGTLAAVYSRRIGPRAHRRLHPGNCRSALSVHEVPPAPGRHRESAGPRENRSGAHSTKK